MDRCPLPAGVDQGTFILERVGLMPKRATLEEMVSALGKIVRVGVQDLLRLRFRNGVDAPKIPLDALSDMHEVPGHTAHSVSLAAWRRTGRICSMVR